MRLGVLDEILDGIRAVKLFSWEPHYCDEISEAREQECGHVKNYRLKLVSSIVLGRVSPVLSGAVTIIVYAALGNELTSRDVFTSVAVFQAMRIALIMLPIAHTATHNTLAVIQRVQSFLTHTDTDPAPHIPPAIPEDAHTVLSLHNASLAWPHGDPVVTGLNMRVSRGQIAAITGEVATGKSTVLSAMIRGGVRVGSGKFFARSDIRVGFAPQTPFLISASLQQNVQLGRAHDQEWYDHCLRVSQLLPDIEMLQDGDQTLIGERGTALSGGQQARCAGG